jgi:hypothetical protein
MGQSRVGRYLIVSAAVDGDEMADVYDLGDPDEPAVFYGNAEDAKAWVSDMNWALDVIHGR